MTAARVKVEIRGVTKRFATDTGEVDALRAIDLDIREGELVCLLGPSGCGKSTLLNIVGGFMEPTEGTVSIDGQLVTEPDRRRITQPHAVLE